MSKAQEAHTLNMDWLDAACDLDSALAVIQLIERSMQDYSDPDTATTHRRALEAAIPLLKGVSEFFEKHEVAGRAFGKDVARG